MNKLEITADKELIAAAGNPHIRIFDVNSSSSHAVHSCDGHTDNVTSIGFHADPRWLFSGSEDGTVRIWDIRAPGCQREFESRAAVNSVVLHPNQNELISADQNGNIRVWDITAGACSCELVPEVGVAVRSLSVASDGSLVVASNSNGTCYVWRSMRVPGQQNASQTSTFEPLHKLKAHKGYVLKSLLSPDVRILATAASDKTIKLWNVEDFSLIRTLVGHQKWVWDCVFSVDAAYLVSASSDSTARLWDLTSGEAIRVYSGHQKACVCCALNDAAADGD